MLMRRLQWEHCSAAGAHDGITKPMTALGFALQLGPVTTKLCILATKGTGGCKLSSRGPIRGERCNVCGHPRSWRSAGRLDLRSLYCCRVNPTPANSASPFSLPFTSNTRDPFGLSRGSTVRRSGAVHIPDLARRGGTAQRAQLDGFRGPDWRLVCQQPRHSTWQLSA